MKITRKKASPAKSKQSKATSARKTRCQDCGLTGLHAPSCRSVFQPSAQAELPIEIVEDGRYWSVDEAELLVKRVAGDTVHYTVDDGEMVFTEKHGRFREIVVKRIGEVEDAPAPGPRDVKATVDGNDASIVIDGTTGKVLQPGEQATLIQTPIEDLVHQLVKHDALIAELASQRGSISNQLKNAKERREEIIAEIKHRDPSAPSLFTPAPELDDIDDEEDAG